MNSRFRPVWVPSRPSFANRWFGYSPKLRREVAVAGNLMSDRLTLLEVDPEVVDFCEYPLETDVLVNGRSIHVRFSYWVKFKTGRERLEAVVPSRAGAQLRAQRLWCKSWHWEFKEWTPTELNRGPFTLTNWKSILSFYTHASHAKRISAILAHKRTLLERLKGAGPMPIGLLVSSEREGRRVEIELAAFDLLREGSAIADLSEQTFSPNTIISPRIL